MLEDEAAIYGPKIDEINKYDANATSSAGRAGRTGCLAILVGIAAIVLAVVVLAHLR